MRKNYTPVQMLVFVNTNAETFAHIKVSTHNTPTLRTRIGKIGRSGVATMTTFDSREAARDRAEEVVDRLVNSGYVQVA